MRPDGSTNFAGHVNAYAIYYAYALDQTHGKAKVREIYGNEAYEIIRNIDENKWNNFWKIVKQHQKIYPDQ